MLTLDRSAPSSAPKGRALRLSPRRLCAVAVACAIGLSPGCLDSKGPGADAEPEVPVGSPSFLWSSNATGDVVFRVGVDAGESEECSVGVAWWAPKSPAGFLRYWFEAEYGFDRFLRGSDTNPALALSARDVTLVGETPSGDAVQMIESIILTAHHHSGVILAIPEVQASPYPGPSIQLSATCEKSQPSIVAIGWEVVPLVPGSMGGAASFRQGVVKGTIVELGGQASGNLNGTMAYLRWLGWGDHAGLLEWIGPNTQLETLGFLNDYWLHGPGGNYTARVWLAQPTGTANSGFMYSLTPVEGDDGY